ncbi:MAG TPA: A/G-specific adenine glycosylase [Terrimesophilobacter sp.]|nr:A/G-specific adenine glycosylase [Terrimesophilobacter sp.]
MGTTGWATENGDDLTVTVAQWYRQHGRDLPWRREGFTPWGSLVSEIMLQQTPVARVLAPLAEWLERWPDAAALAQASVADVVRAWGRLGYPRRALRLRDAAITIVEHHGGEVPSNIDDLLALPGVGDYTARAIAAFAFGQRVPVVDTNVRRVIARAVHGRADAAPPSTRRDLADAEALLPDAPAEAAEFSAALMELGAIICTARAPQCDACPLAHVCRWRLNGYPAHDGPRRAVQAKYEGSDRQVRGLVLALLRDAERCVSHAELDQAWADPEQLRRAIDTLASDGLIVREGDGYRLPE